MKLKALRGATYAENTAESIKERVVELYTEMLTQNSLKPSKTVCVIISTTTDLNAACPATAIRLIYDNGKNPPLFSVNEPEFDRAERGIIRLLILGYTKKSVRVYLRGTNNLIGDKL